MINSYNSGVRVTLEGFSSLLILRGKELNLSNGTSGDPPALPGGFLINKIVWIIFLFFSKDRADVFKKVRIELLLIHNLPT